MKKLKGKAMRKTLLASAALIVMGGGAYAEVSVTGSGNFGVKFDGAKSGSEALTFHHEFDIAFAASGTTDGGLTFGGKVTVDDRESLVTPGTTNWALKAEKKKGAKSCYIDTRGATGQIFLAEAAADLVQPPPAGSKPIMTSDISIDPTPVGSLGGPFHIAKHVLAANNIEDGALRRIKVIENADGEFVVDTIYSNTDGSFQSAIAASPQDQEDIYFYEVREIPECSGIAVTQATAGTGTSENNASVHIGFDVHTLTIGNGLDAGDVDAGGVADVGFDGIGVDDVAHSLRGKTNADVRYTGKFGVAEVAVSSGGDDWGVGFKFKVAPVTIGVGFDSMKVASIGLGLEQGPVSGKMLYSTASQSGKKAYGAQIGYTISEGTSVTIVYSQSKDPMGSDGDAVGFGFAHGLGGGATLAAGIGQVNDETKADLGIKMEF